MKKICFFLFFICLLIIGCVSDDTPSGVIRIFYSAVLKDDLETFSKYAVFSMESPGYWFYYATVTLDGYGKIKNLSETINGNDAFVKATFEYGSYDFHLVNISGKWKVPFSFN